MRPRKEFDSQMIINKAILVGSATAGLLLFSTGCATKGHVRAAIAPVENRVGVVEKRATQAEADVDALEKQLSSTTEIASGAEREAKLAKDMANTADGKAVAAGRKADGAQVLAEKSMTRIGEVQTELTKSIDNLAENLDNYQVAREESITFAFNRSDLTKDMKEKLDEIASAVKDQQKYVVEVQGFTDKVGTSNYNQELSQKRAMTVARYLSGEHDIPLRRIQMLGVGSLKPVADNKTREGRKANRRVEVKVYTLQTGGKSAPAIAKSL